MIDPATAAQVSENIRNAKMTGCQCCGTRLSVADVSALVEEKNALIRRVAALEVELVKSRQV